MKKLLLFFVLFSFSQFVNSQTIIPAGNVTGIWSTAGSPFLVQGNIIVPNGSILTIQPGVLVSFQGPYNLLVLGELSAIGTPSDSIEFTASNVIAPWDGIRFDYTPSTNDTSKLFYCKIHESEGFSGGTNNGGGVYMMQTSKVIISNCHIYDNEVTANGAGIYCNNSNPLIVNNLIRSNKSHSSGAGIYCYQSSPMIINNIILSNFAYGNGAGIWCYNYSNASIIHNTISYNTATSVTFPGAWGKGGGIYGSSSNLIIDSNSVSNNISTHIGGGGGMYFEDGQLSITNNTISNNSAPNGDGGGIACYGGSGNVISNNIISNNTAGSTPVATSRDGGGINLVGSLSTVSYNIITGNQAYRNGGGVSCSKTSFYTSNPTITNNSINNNTSSTRGGAIFCDANNPLIQYNVLSNNTSMLGGGIYFEEASPPTSNNLICNNEASEGGGIFCHSINSGSNPIIENNTIVNDSANYGGGIACYESSPIVRNTILYGNKSVNGGDQVFLFESASKPDFIYCNVWGDSSAFGYSFLLDTFFYSGNYQNNISVDPLFVSPAAGSGLGYSGFSADWSLQMSSPCINAGDPVGSYPLIDLAGNPRIHSSTVDIGAYEALLISGIQNHSSSLDLTFHPNPFISSATIILSEDRKNSTLQITDVLGKEIRTVNFSGQQLVIEKKEMQPGIYFIKIFDETKTTQTKKIIVQ